MSAWNVISPVVLLVLPVMVAAALRVKYLGCVCMAAVFWVGASAISALLYPEQFPTLGLREVIGWTIGIANLSFVFGAAFWVPGAIYRRIRNTREPNSLPGLNRS